jgi:hypothetical protein
MKVRPGIIRLGIAAAIILIPADVLRAQQVVGSSPIAPIAPIQSRQMPVPGARTGDIEPAAAPVNADTHTLSSFEALGIGSLGVLTNDLDPSIRFTQAGGNTATANWEGITALGMNLDFADHGTHSHLTGYYRGSRVLYFPDNGYNSTYNNLGIAEEYRAARWLFRIREDFLSSTQVGLGGVDLAGVPMTIGASLMNALPATAEVDTILTARAKRSRSVTSGEINYLLSRRSTLTLAGTFTSSTYSTAGFIDTQRTSGRIGYDYFLSPKNAVGIFYEESQMRFAPVPYGLRTDSAQFAFGRRLTGRMAFQVSAGPMRIAFGNTSHQLNWTVSSNVFLQGRRIQYTLGYTHSTAGGSGIFTGVTSHIMMASVRYRLTPWWTLSDTVGYAFNQNLGVTGAVTDHIGNWYDSAALERVFGRHVQFALNYALQAQNGAAAICATTACAPNAIRQTVGATLEWHPWKITQR